jgi:glycosyltransferase involved in cell wall biosynthesis
MQDVDLPPRVHPGEQPAESPRRPPGPPVAPPTVDIVLPVYDEEAILERSVERLHTYLSRHFPFTWRITVVDNASTDGTWRTAENLAAGLDHVRSVHLDRKGRGLALRTAWTESDAAVVAYMDVDLSTDLDALLPLVAPLVSGHSDVAIGSRLAPTSSVARAPKREFISRTYNLILRTVMATRVRDAQCGFKAVRSDVARRLVPAVEDDGWFFDTELLLLAERNGLRIHEVPVTWVDDPDSRVRIANTAWNDLKGTARMFRTFASGQGKIDFGPAARRPLADDFGRRIVSFGLIGAASTLVSLVIFLLLRTPLGPVGANFVAVSTTFLANTWANARLTMRVDRPRWGHAFLLYLASLVLTSAALLMVDALGGGLWAQVAALLVTWTIAAVGRLVLMARERHRDAEAR